MTEPLELVAFDIETTGLGVSDEVTTVGFAVSMGVRVFCQTGGRPAPDLEAAVRAQTDQVVQLSTHESEQALLEAVTTFTADRVSTAEVLLIAYNGETWDSGFDLPFLRTRLAATGVEWPFRDVPYADLMPIVTDRFNTTVDGEEGAQRDLASVYATLCDGQYGDLDPFEESAAAVTAFENGAFRDLVLHNMADVLRTRQLGTLAQRYCSKSDFSLKSLTPTIHG